jgi:hypothetical protein
MPRGAFGLQSVRRQSASCGRGFLENRELGKSSGYSQGPVAVDREETASCPCNPTITRRVQGGWNPQFAANFASPYFCSRVS